MVLQVVRFHCALRDGVGLGRVVGETDRPVVQQGPGGLAENLFLGRRKAAPGRGKGGFDPFGAKAGHLGTAENSFFQTAQFAADETAGRGFQQSARQQQTEHFVLAGGQTGHLVELSGVVIPAPCRFVFERCVEAVAQEADVPLGGFDRDFEVSGEPRRVGIAVFFHLLVEPGQTFELRENGHSVCLRSVAAIV